MWPGECRIRSHEAGAAASRTFGKNAYLSQAVRIQAEREHTEERTLRAELAGYDEYLARVRYRLIPYVWQSGATRYRGRALARQRIG